MTASNNLIVMDLEATCWATEEERKGSPQEIIEIGICKLNTSTLEISDKQSIIIRPYFQKWGLSDYCTKLTGHTSEQVKKGIRLEHALNRLKKQYGIAKKYWATWGKFDRVLLQNECLAKKIDYPFSSEHINANAWFKFFCGTSKNIGVSGALNYFGLTFEGRPHRADDDAYNTARIIKAMFGLRSKVNE